MRFKQVQSSAPVERLPLTAAGNGNSNGTGLPQTNGNSQVLLSTNKTPDQTNHSAAKDSKNRPPSHPSAASTEPAKHQVPDNSTANQIELQPDTHSTLTTKIGEHLNGCGQRIGSLDSNKGNHSSTSHTNNDTSNDSNDVPNKSDELNDSIIAQGLPPFNASSLGSRANTGNNHDENNQQLQNAQQIDHQANNLVAGPIRESTNHKTSNDKKSNKAELAAKAKKDKKAKAALAKAEKAATKKSKKSNRNDKQMDGEINDQSCNDINNNNKSEGTEGSTNSKSFNKITTGPGGSHKSDADLSNQQQSSTTKPRALVEELKLFQNNHLLNQQDPIEQLHLQLNELIQNDDDDGISNHCSKSKALHKQKHKSNNKKQQNKSDSTGLSSSSPFTIVSQDKTPNSNVDHAASIHHQVNQQQQPQYRKLDPFDSEASAVFTIKKGVLWQQQNYDKFHQRLFSRWKKRYFILTTDYLVCFKRSTPKVGRSEMGKFLYKTSLSDVSQIRWLRPKKTNKGSIVLNIRGGQFVLLLWCKDNLNEWMFLISESINRAKVKRQNNLAGLGARPLISQQLDQATYENTDPLQIDASAPASNTFMGPENIASALDTPNRNDEAEPEDLLSEANNSVNLSQRRTKPDKIEDKIVAHKPSLIRRDDSWQSLVSLNRIGNVSSPSQPTALRQQMIKRSLYAQHIMPHSLDTSNGGIVIPAREHPSAVIDIESSCTPLRAPSSSVLRQAAMHSTRGRPLPSPIVGSASNQLDAVAGVPLNRFQPQMSYQHKLMQLQLLHNSNNVDYIRGSVANDYSIYGADSVVHYGTLRSNHLKSATSEFAFIRPTSNQSTLPHKQRALIAAPSNELPLINKQQYLVNPATGRLLISPLSMEAPNRELPLKPPASGQQMPKSNSLGSSIVCFFKRAFSRRGQRFKKKTESCSSSLGHFEHDALQVTPSAYSTGSKSVRRNIQSPATRLPETPPLQIISDQHRLVQLRRPQFGSPLHKSSSISAMSPSHQSQILLPIDPNQVLSPAHLRQVTTPTNGQSPMMQRATRVMSANLSASSSYQSAMMQQQHQHQAMFGSPRGGPPALPRPSSIYGQPSMISSPGTSGGQFGLHRNSMHERVASNQGMEQTPSIDAAARLRHHQFVKAPSLDPTTEVMEEVSPERGSVSVKLATSQSSGKIGASSSSRRAIVNPILQQNAMETIYDNHPMLAGAADYENNLPPVGGSRMFVDVHSGRPHFEHTNQEESRMSVMLSGGPTQQNQRSKPSAIVMPSTSGGRSPMAARIGAQHEGPVVNILSAPGISLEPALAASLLRGTNIDAYESSSVYEKLPTQAPNQLQAGDNKTFLVSTRLSRSIQARNCSLAMRQRDSFDRSHSSEASNSDSNNNCNNNGSFNRNQTKRDSTPSSSSSRRRAHQSKLEQAAHSASESSSSNPTKQHSSDESSLDNSDDSGGGGGGNDDDNEHAKDGPEKRNWITSKLVE